MLTLSTSLKQQSGVVLVISLVMLLLLTLIGVTAMQTSGLEEKMAGNARDRNLAFQAAESALAWVENDLDNKALNNNLPSFTSSGTGGFYNSTPSVDISNAKLSTSAFWTTNPVATATASNLGNDITQPQYIIQKLTQAKTYRITVRATGGSKSAVVVLQSVYVTP